ncbi:MAG: YidC/Oxa1 family membrane protein insertase [Candidatus Dormibacteria bacterium]
MNFGSLFDVFKPLHTLWWNYIGVPIGGALGFLYNHLQNVPVVSTIGAYGISIILLTVLLRLLLAPLFHFQLSTTRKNMLNQRKLQPEIAKLRKKYKKEPQKLNEATMALYKEHDVHPLASMAGCLPSLVQMPILIALFYVLQKHGGVAIHNSHFLWIGDLNTQKDVVLAGFAGVLTWVQTRMMTSPAPASADGEPDPTQTMNQTMQYLSPAMVFIFGLQWQAGLPLYWAVSTGFGIIQQYFVTGWGSLPLLGGKS